MAQHSRPSQWLVIKVAFIVGRIQRGESEPQALGGIYARDCYRLAAIKRCRGLIAAVYLEIASTSQWLVRRYASVSSVFAFTLEDVDETLLGFEIRRTKQDTEVDMQSLARAMAKGVKRHRRSSGESADGPQA